MGSEGTPKPQGIAGEMRAEFLVRADGAVDPGSTRFLKATSIEFADAIASVLPQMRFFPLEVAGCKVASLTQMPFDFGMNR